MQCPKCGSGVPDNSTQCHICFAPLDPSRPGGPVGLQVPQVRPPIDEENLVAGIPGIDRRGDAGDQDQGPRPNYLNQEPTPNYLSPGTTAPSMGGGQVRVSLTGEVIEVPAATPSGPVAYTPPGVTAPGPPRPGAYPSGPLPPSTSGPMPQRGSYARPPRQEAAPAKSGAGAAIAVVIVLLLMGGGGFGGWWWWNHRTNPKEQAQKAYSDVLKGQFREFFYLCAWPDTVHPTAADADEFTAAAEKSYEQSKKVLPSQIVQALQNMEITTGDPVINGDRADVPTTGKLSVGGMNITLNGTAHMVLRGGLWKLDMETADLHNAASIQKPLVEMIGKPSGMPAMGGFGGMGGK